MSNATIRIQFEINGYFFGINTETACLEVPMCIANVPDRDDPDFRQALSEAVKYASMYVEMNYLADVYDVTLANDFEKYKQDWRNNKPILRILFNRCAGLKSQTVFELMPSAVKMIDVVEALAYENIPPSRFTTSSAIKGYVYILRSHSGHYKIGKSLNPEDRLKTFTIKLPFEVQYTMLIPSNDYSALEVYLHRMFESKRINGEWFALDDEDLAAIEKEFICERV